MDQQTIWLGLRSSGKYSRSSRPLITQNVTMEPGHDLTLPGMRKTTDTSARKAKSCDTRGETTQIPPEMRRNGKRRTTARSNLIAETARQKPNTAPTQAPAVSAARNTKSFAILPGNALLPNTIRRHRGGARRWRCSSNTSNVSLAWGGSDYADHVASKMNLLSQLPLKTSGNWPN